MNLKYFDVRWSNICNFKCRSCGSLYSSSWAAEDNKQHNTQKEVFIFAGGKNNDNLYNQFLPHFSNMQEIYFAGGEPLLTDKHYDILEHLISIGKTDVELRYNTNLSNLNYKNKNVIELWKKFSNVNINASLDSWGARAEYIREGTEWELIEKNIRLIKTQTPHIKLQTATVVSVFNVSTIPDFLNYLLDTKLFDKDDFFPNFYNLITPYEYSFQILPDNFRNEIITKLSSFDSSPYINREINGIINKLDNTVYDDSLNQKFKIVNDRYDKIRNRNFIETFPELSNLYL
jgi:sulfatase maturation enzyme AslB (radical SAM superfamily)